MDFTVPDDLVELRERTEAFVREEMIPRENDDRLGHHGPSEDFRHELVALGRRAGLISPHVGREWGGLGLDHRGKAVVFEAAGYSPLGPIAMNCFAPDEANMHLLEQVADEAQKERIPAPARRRRHPLVLYDDRAGAGLRLRPVDAADDRAPRRAIPAISSSTARNG